MSRLFRRDSGSFADVRTIAGNRVIVRGLLARTGVQEYLQADGTTRREYRPPEEVFAPATLASLRAAPVVRGHGAGRIKPENWAQNAIGTLLGGQKAEARADGQEWIEGEVAFSDESAIKDLGTGIVENSLAYDMRWDPTPGVTTSGEKYDGVQRDIIVNSLGVGGLGFARAGRSARLKLDGNEETEDSTEEVEMAEKITCDGVTVEKGSDTHVSLLDRQIAREKTRADAAESRVAQLEKDFGTEKSRADGLQAKLTEAENKLKTDGSPEAIDARIKSELEFRGSVIKFVGDGYDFKGKSKAVVLRDAIAKIRPDAKFAADASETVLQAYLDGAVGSGIDYNRDGGNGGNGNVGSTFNSDSSGAFDYSAAIEAKLKK